MTPDIFPDTIEAKCGECGHIWPYARHDVLACPFCNARLESVEFNWDKTMAFFQGRRWKRINKDEKAHWERLAAAPSAIRLKEQ